MRILAVLERWQTGGTEQYVSTLYTALRSIEPQWSIDLALVRGADLADIQEQKNWIGKLVELAGSASRLRNVIRQENVQVVHLHLYTSTLRAALATKLGASRNPALVTTFHSPLSQWHWRHRAAFWTAAKLSDAVMGGSEFTTGQLRHWRADAISAPPPLSVEETSLIAERSEDCIRPFTIVGCGRLSREKDWATLIAAFAASKCCESAVCELIGSGPMESDLKRLIANLDCGSRCRLLGKLSHQETLRRIASADLFVLPSRFEGFGIAAVEAMSLGTPTITSDFPASQEYIEADKTAHQFPIGDSEALARLIDWHICHRADSRRMGEAGRQSVLDRFSAHRSACLHRDLYQRFQSTNADFKSEPLVRNQPSSP